MKKILSLLTIIIGLAIFNTTFADSCKEVYFDNGRVCVNIEKESDDKFTFKTDIEKGSDTLRCALLLGDNSYKSVDCNGEFTTTLNNERLVKVYLKLGGYLPTDRDGKPNDKTARTFPQWMYDFDAGERSDSSSTSTTSNGDLDNYSISASDSTPAKNDRVDVTIKSRDEDDSTITNYRGTIKFKVEKKSGSSRSTASSTYYSLAKTSYTFSSSDKGSKKISDLIKFKQTGEFRLTVYSSSDTSIKSTKTFDVGGTSSSSSSTDLDTFSMSLSDSTPAANASNILTIKALDSDGDTLSDYDGSNADITVEYRTSSTSSRQETTSSSYFSIDDSTPTFSNGKATTDITFKKEYNYRVTVTDSDSDVESTKIFYVGNSSTSSTDLDHFSIALSDSTPEEDDSNTLTIKALDSDEDTLSDYDGANAEITVEYRTSSSSSRQETSSSTYFDLDDSTPTFSNGKATTDITFKYNYDYRITINDNDSDVESTKIFYVGSSSSSSSSSDLNHFTMTLSDTTPEEDIQNTLTIKAVDNNESTLSDYDGANAKIVIAYRTSSSSSRQETTSSSYFSIDDTTPTFSNGKATTDITFKYEYDYKVTVTDDDSDTESTKIFYIGNTSTTTSNGDLDHFTLSLSDSTPEADDENTLTIKALDNDGDQLSDYDGANAKISVEYRTSSAYSRSKTTSTSIVDMDDTTPTFSNGKASTNITFKKEYDYRITVTDDDSDMESSKIFEVGNTSSSSSSDLDSFAITSSPSYPSKNERVDITVKALDDNEDTLGDYRGTVKFKVERKSGGSWIAASSSYYSLERTSYTFTSSNDGEKKFTDLIKFTSNNEFRLVAYDSNDTSIKSYKTFNVGSSSSSNSDTIYSFYTTTSPTTPDKNEWIDLTIKAYNSDSEVIDTYTHAINLKVQKKVSGSWETAPSSEYDIEKTYYKFTASDYGKKSFSDFIRFSKEAAYRLVITDNTDTSITKTITFDVGSSTTSSTDGFTSSELTSIQSSYDKRDQTIQTYKDSYSSLRYNTTWITYSNEVKTAMKNILNGNPLASYDTYDEFQTNIYNIWYKLTNQLK